MNDPCQFEIMSSNQMSSGHPVHVKATNVRHVPSDEQKANTTPNPADKLQAYFRNPLFLKAVSLIPDAHVADSNYKDKTGLMPIQDRRVLSAFLRWSDPICNTCWKKKNVRLHRCTCCGLVAYCSSDCQRKQWQAHKEYVSHLPKTPKPWPNDPFTPVIVDLGKNPRAAGPPSL